jgi:hypothetical protein
MTQQARSRYRAFKAQGCQDRHVVVNRFQQAKKYRYRCSRAKKDNCAIVRSRGVIWRMLSVVGIRRRSVLRGEVEPIDSQTSIGFPD